VWRRWYCPTCLGRGFFYGLCDQCHTDPGVRMMLDEPEMYPTFTLGPMMNSISNRRLLCVVCCVLC
jgi:hypothetical protein